MRRLILIVIALMIMTLPLAAEDPCSDGFVAIEPNEDGTVKVTGCEDGTKTVTTYPDAAAAKAAGFDPDAEGMVKVDADADADVDTSGAGASSGGTFSCGKMGDSPTPSTTDPDAAKDATGTSGTGALQDQALFNAGQSQGSGGNAGTGGGGGDAEFEEMECDPPNDVGVFVCYGIAGPTSAYCCNPETSEQIPFFEDCWGCPAM